LIESFLCAQVATYGHILSSAWTGTYKVVVKSKSTQITLHEPVYNERGIIAENYHDLQGLGILESTRHAYPHRFDRKVIHLIEAGALTPEAAIAEQSLGSWQYNFFHLIKICNHESTIWEHNLAEVRCQRWSRRTKNL